MQQVYLVLRLQKSKTSPITFNGCYTFILHFKRAISADAECIGINFTAGIGILFLKEKRDVFTIGHKG